MGDFTESAPFGSLAYYALFFLSRPPETVSKVCLEITNATKNLGVESSPQQALMLGINQGPQREVSAEAGVWPVREILPLFFGLTFQLSLTLARVGMKSLVIFLKRNSVCVIYR